MARYFFSLVDGRTIADTDGEDHASLDTAKAAAIQAAHDLARNKPPTQITGFYVSVTDEDGKEVFRTPLR